MVSFTLSACVDSLRLDSASSAMPSPRERAMEAEQRGDWDSAAGHWRSAVERDPANRLSRLSLARSLRLSGSCGPAATAISPLLLGTPADADALIESAKCHLVSERPEAAEAHLIQAIAANPNSWEAESALAVTLDRTGRHDEALAHHDRAIQIAGEKPIVLANKALSRAMAGALDEAIALMRRAAAAPGAPARVRMNLAVLEALSGKGDRAATIASQEVFEAKEEGLQLLRRLAAGTGNGAEAR